jgi:hypothetical protein
MFYTIPTLRMAEKRIYCRLPNVSGSVAVNKIENHVPNIELLAAIQRVFYHFQPKIRGILHCPIGNQ